MVRKELSSPEDFHKAVQTKDRNVFIFLCEGEVPPPARENAKRFTATTDPYSVDVSKFPQAKENLKLSNIPAAVVFRNGEEVKRVEHISPESMKEIEQILTG